MIYLKLPLLETLKVSKLIINILYFTAPAELNQNIKYCKSQ